MHAHQLAPTVQLPRRPMGLFALDLDRPEFQLSDEFLKPFSTKEIDWGPTGYITYKRTYSRFQNPDVGGAFRLTAVGESEEWWQTVGRVVEGTYQIQQRHCAYQNVPWEREKALRSAQEMYERIFSFKFTPPGRGLWMMGTPFVRIHGSAALNNCAFTTTERIGEKSGFSEPFTFLMDLSMLGVGVGSDTRGTDKITIRGPCLEVERSTFVIPDSREGWVQAVDIALRAYAYGEPLPYFNYDAIRPAGELIRGFGGVAAGPDPLRDLVERHIPMILDPLIGKPITSEAIVDIFNAIGKCVVAGNVRRSAEIMFGSPYDEEFLRLKDPTHAPPERLNGKDSWRWNSNNSIFAEVGMDYTTAASFSSENGEPGYLWLDNVRAYGRMKDPPNWADRAVVGSNPCVEQSLEDRELCCLVETFPSRHEGYEDYKRTLKFAYLYAKTVTLLPTHLPRTNAVMMKNRRIGCSQSGIVQNFKKVGFREHLRWCDAGYEHLQFRDKQYSDWLGVAKSIKTTSVKPSGTVSKLCGATSGIHYPPSEYYIQRITFNKDHPMLDELRRAGYPVEVYRQSPDRTMVVEIPVKEKDFYKSEKDASAWEQLENAAQMQSIWADNQVSCTVKFDKEREGPHIQAMLERYERSLKGISFLPEEGHGYDQAPWEPISREEYERRAAIIKPLKKITAETADQPEKFCDGASCEI